MSYSSASDLYTVDADFVDDIKAYPILLANDATYFVSVTGGFEFRSVVSGSLASELGFQDNDRPLTVGGHYVRTTDEVLDALESVYASTAISVRVQRGASVVTLDYLIR